MNSEIKSSMTFDGQLDPMGYRMIAALVSGGINEVPVAHLEFVARDKSLDLGKLVGSDIGFWVEDEHSKRQPFFGTCISAEAKGASQGEGHYVAEIRPWLWFLTRSKNNRIFQEQKTTDIVKEILGEYGFSGDLVVNHSGSDALRTYCVQYAETDLNFIKRLLEEEGFYFYFEYEDNKVRMVLADQPSTHGSATQDDTYKYNDEAAGGGREIIKSWQTVEKVVTGKVTLRDYDFTKPTSDLTASAELESGAHGHQSYENYIYPGRYSDVSNGENRAAALIEEHAKDHKVWAGVGTMLNLNVGKIFEIEDHPRHESASDNGFMVTKVTQFINVGEASLPGASVLKSDPAYLRALGGAMQDLYAASGDEDETKGAEASFEFVRTKFDAVLKSKPYRGPGTTPRPRMMGVQTAVVTGPSGDEIHVDKYGRIKVQFHWDRNGKKDEKTSCWVRTMMPWTGKNWGMVALPRIGQEVVIQFEEGDPDRPICVGMLYNADTMPPYALPANATMTGVKTNTSKGGSGYNELVMEDKKGEELVRFMAQKDFVQNVQNQAHIKVGYDHPKDVREAAAQDAKSMKIEVQNHLDEIVETGDHSFAVQTGNQTVEIKQDQTVTVKKNASLTVTDDLTTKVESGDMTTTVSSGNISISAESGKIAMEAAQEIKLTCGSSVITLKPAEISIESVNISIGAQAQLTAEGTGTAELKSSGMTTVKGSLVKIN